MPKFNLGRLRWLDLLGTLFLVVLVGTTTYLAANPTIRQLISSQARYSPEALINQRERAGGCKGKYCLAGDIINNAKKNPESLSDPTNKEIVDTFNKAAGGDTAALQTLKDGNTQLYEVALTQSKSNQTASQQNAPAPTASTNACRVCRAGTCADTHIDGCNSALNGCSIDKDCANTLISGNFVPTPIPAPLSGVTSIERQKVTSTTNTTVTQPTQTVTINPTTLKIGLGGKCFFSSDCDSGNCAVSAVQGRGGAGRTCQAAPAPTPPPPQLANQNLQGTYNFLNTITFGQFGQYTASYAPGTVIPEWQQLGFTSLDDCVKNAVGRAKTACNTYTPTKQQFVSSVQLGTTLTSEGALLATGIGGLAEAAGGTALKAVGGQILTQTLAIQAQNTTGNAVATCIVNGVVTTQCGESAALAALSWANVGAIDYVANAAAVGGEQALQNARIVNTGVSFLNAGFTGGQAVQSCFGEHRSSLGCVLNATFTAAAAYTGASELGSLAQSRAILNISESEQALSRITPPASEVRNVSTLLADAKTVGAGLIEAAGGDIVMSDLQRNLAERSFIPEQNVLTQLPETGGQAFSSVTNPKAIVLEQNVALPAGKNIALTVEGKTFAPATIEEAQGIISAETGRAAIIDPATGTVTFTTPEVAAELPTAVAAQTAAEAKPGLADQIKNWYTRTSEKIAADLGIVTPAQKSANEELARQIALKEQQQVENRLNQVVGNTVTDFIGPTEIPAGKTGAELVVQLKVDQTSVLNGTGLPDPKLINQDPQTYIKGLNSVVEKNGLEPLALSANPTAQELKEATTEVVVGMANRYGIADDVLGYQVGLATNDIGALPANSLPQPDSLQEAIITSAAGKPLTDTQVQVIKDSLNSKIADLEDQLLTAQYVDKETGLLNKTGGEAGLKIAISEAKGRPVTIIDLGLTDLKKVNDSLGHGAGDRLIRDAGNLIDYVVRDSNLTSEDALVIHLKGNKYRLVLPGADEAGAQNLIDKINDAVRILKNSSPEDDVIKNLGFDTGTAVWKGTETADELAAKASTLREASKNTRVVAEAAGIVPPSVASQVPPEDILGPSQLPAQTGTSLTNQIKTDQTALFRDTGLPDPALIVSDPQGYVSGLNDVITKNGLDPLTLPDVPTQADLEVAGAKVEKALIDKYEAFTPQKLAEYKVALAITDLKKLSAAQIPQLNPNIENALFTSPEGEIQLLRQRVTDLKILLNDVKYKDPMTGLLNNTGGEIGLNEVLDAAKTTKGPVSIIGIDVAGLNKINAELGEPFGNKVITQGGGIFDTTARRSSDIVFRVGSGPDEAKVVHSHGDEFMLILPGTDAAGAQIVIDRFYEELAARRALNPNDEVLQKLWFDAGVSQWNGSETPEGLLTRVDEAMYANKNARKAAQAIAAVPAKTNILEQVLNRITTFWQTLFPKKTK